jgi:hypothetical protein
MNLIYKLNMNLHNTFCAVDSENVNRQTSCAACKKTVVQLN